MFGPQATFWETLQEAFGVQQVVFTLWRDSQIIYLEVEPLTLEIVKSCQEGMVKAASLIWHLMGIQTLRRPFLGHSLDPAIARRIAGPVRLVAETLVLVSWLLSSALMHISVWKLSFSTLARSGWFPGLLLFSRHSFCGGSHRAIAFFTIILPPVSPPKGESGRSGGRRSGSRAYSSKSWSELCH